MISTTGQKPESVTHSSSHRASKGMTVSKLLSLAAGEDLTRDVCCRLLSTVGLCANEYIEREVDGTLSGGEMKRLEIATVLAKPHKLCIFDEPEAGIDLWRFFYVDRTV